MFQRDHLLRLVRDLGVLLTRSAGQRSRGDVDEAQATLDEAYARIIGMPRRMLDALDAASVVLLLGAPEKVDMVVKLLAEEADILDASGRQHAAEARRDRARAIAARAGLPVPLRA